MTSVGLDTELNIDKTNWTPVCLGDVVEESRGVVRDPVKEGIERVVGLEHIDSESIHLRRWETLEQSTTFTKKFVKGQVLFGRRRAYLKKAALAPFDGICSGDITVLEAKEGLLPELLPFLINNDRFFDFAIKNSAGSLSPRAKFKDLANYEFLLPPKDQQARLAELLWAADEVVEKDLAVLLSLERLIATTRMSLNNDTYTCLKGSEITTLITKGASPKWQGFDYCDSGTLFVTSENVLEDEIDLKEKKYLPLGFNEKQKRSQLKANDVLINIVGASIGRVAKFNNDEENVNINQAVALFRLNNSIALPDYIVQYLLEKENLKRLLNQQSETARPNLSLKDLSDYKFFLPSLEIQKQKVEEFKMLKELILDARKKISSTKQLQKSLINQIF